MKKKVSIILILTMLFSMSMPYATPTFPIDPTPQTSIDNGSLLLGFIATLLIGYGGLDYQEASRATVTSQVAADKDFYLTKVYEQSPEQYAFTQILEDTYYAGRTTVDTSKDYSYLGLNTYTDVIKNVNDVLKDGKITATDVLGKLNIWSWIKGEYEEDNPVSIPDYQTWNNYPSTTDLTAIYPYQLIYNTGTINYLTVSNSPYIIDGTQLENTPGTTAKTFKLIGTTTTIWSNYSSITTPLEGTVYNGFNVSYCRESNHDIKDATGNIVFSKTTTNSLYTPPTNIDLPSLSIAQRPAITTAIETAASTETPLTLEQQIALIMEQYAESQANDDNVTIETASLETPGDVTTYPDPTEELGFLEQISDILQSLIDWVANGFQNVIEYMAQMPALIVTAITGMIQAAFPDFYLSEPPTGGGSGTTPGPFDILWILIAILIAILMYMIQMIAFVFMLKDVPANGGMLPAQIKQAVDFLHAAQLPGFEMSFMALINSTVTVLMFIAFGAAIMNRVNRISSGSMKVDKNGDVVGW